MNRSKVISGIQQIGIGNTDVVQTTEWYRLPLWNGYNGI